ncbi:response regulator [Rubellimicrobium roseum]|uniref:Response regulator n=1 Tax=Rubellimicrobium roseum TaxID=687525 RepID=A0A5C4NBN6_9RHOB|nr:response regulator [Rubellimicrobium roseum]TNC72151.1 response regulator [Rubellimicrobium roseum]
MVQDDFITAEDFAMELEGPGAEVMGSVPDLAGALSLLDSGPHPDAAILDINLGGEIVFPLADRLRDWAIPFVFAPGYEQWAIPEPYASQPRCEKPLDMRQVARIFAG